MILLLRSAALTNCKRILTLKNGSHFIHNIRKSFHKIPAQRQSTPFVKPGKICILPGVFLHGILVVKCRSADTNSEYRDELIHPYLVTQEETFDWRQFLSLLKPEALRLLLAIITAVAVAMINVQLPLHLGKIVDILSRVSINNIDTSFLEQLREPAFKLFSIYVMQAFLTFLYVDLLSIVGENISSTLKNKLFASVMQQDLTFFDKTRTGEIIDRLTTDVHEFKSAFKMCISQGIRSSTQILGCFVSLITISPEMTGVLFIILPTCILIGTVLGSTLRSISRNAQEQAAWSTILAEETLSNIRTVRAFSMEEHECKKFGQEVEKTSILYKKLGFGIALFQAGTNIFLNGIVLLTLGMGGYMLSVKKLSAGNIMSFLVAMQTIQKSLAQVSLLFGHFVKGVASGTRVLQYIDLQPKIPLKIDHSKVIAANAFNTDISFEDVSFRYPTRPEQVILRNFNLKIPAGKVAAIVGSSGNGKSTVAALLLKFYDVTSGSIKIGGKDLNELDESWLRGKVIGFINQEPVLFATSVKENIRYGDPSASDEEVYEAAKLANAHEFITSFPDGYDTVCGEKGTAISGGQKQRIAIARAFLKKPQVLVLDEATSALDTVSEHQVQQSLESVMKGRTVLVIAHRLSTIKNADVIVVLDKGKIVEVGKHEELIAKKGFYYNLMNMQANEKS